MTAEEMIRKAFALIGKPDPSPEELQGALKIFNLDWSDWNSNPHEKPR